MNPMKQKIMNELMLSFPILKLWRFCNAKIISACFGGGFLPNPKGETSSQMKHHGSYSNDMGVKAFGRTNQEQLFYVLFLVCVCVCLLQDSRKLDGPRTHHSSTYKLIGTANGTAVLL